MQGGREVERVYIEKWKGDRATKPKRERNEWGKMQDKKVEK